MKTKVVFATIITILFGSTFVYQQKFANAEVESPVTSPLTSPITSPITSPSLTPTFGISETPTPSITETPSVTPTESVAPSESPTLIPSATPSATVTPTPSPIVEHATLAGRITYRNLGRFWKSFGKVVAAVNVKVTATNRATGEKTETTTNANGYYWLTLPSSKYRITVEDGKGTKFVPPFRNVNLHDNREGVNMQGLKFGGL